jgi:hypothetical protein
LIIGVNEYQDNTFQPLRFAENDARALAQWLVNTKGGKWSPPDVQLVQGQYATREVVESLITQICLHKAEPGDVVLLYFAGHALVDAQTGEGYLALVNSQYQTASTHISLLSFTQQVMARSRATHILCVVDCFQNGQAWSACRTSPFDSKPLLSSAALTTLQHMPNRLFLCSCRGNEFAPEGGEHSLGFTAHMMIVGLCGPASDPTTGNILLPGFHAYLFNKLSEQHKPQLFGQQQFPLILVGELPTPTITRTLLGSSSAQWATPPIMPNTPIMPNGQNTPSFIKPRVASGLLTRSAPLSEQMTPQPQSPPSSPLPPPVPSPAGQVPISMINKQSKQQSQYMMEQARQCFQAQNYGEAFHLTEQVLRLNPADTSALTLKGQLLGVASRFPEAMPVIDQLLQINPNDALGWSMRAVALTNMGNHQEALAAVERSLELDARNPETYSLKNAIMANMTTMQSQSQSQGPVNQQPVNNFTPTNTKPNGAVVFMTGLGLHILGVIVGFVGFALLIVLRSAPAPVGLSLISIGLAIACVNAARGSFRYGFIHLVLALLLSLIAGGILGAAYKAGLTILMNQINVHPTLLSPLLLLAGWLAILALLPLLLAIGGLISGLIAHTGRH